MMASMELAKNVG